MAAPKPLEVWCDESGNDGENVLSGRSTVFAHASVTLPRDAASNLMAEVRARTRARSTELKSKTILQPRHQSTAEWLLAQPSIENWASVHLTHKKYFLVSKLYDSTAEELAHERGHDIYVSGVALAGANLLFFLGPKSYGPEWDRLLMTFQRFMRARDAGEAESLLVTMVQTTQSMLADEDAIVRSVLDTVFAGLHHLSSLSRLQLGEGINERLRTTDPLISAVGATVRFWALKSGRPVSLFHDPAKELTPTKIEWVRQSLAHPENIAPSRRGLASKLAGVSLVDSLNDPRVQVADLLAGIGRVVGESLAEDRRHPLLSSLAPIVSGASIWPIRENMNVANARKAMYSQS